MLVALKSRLSGLDFSTHHLRRLIMLVGRILVVHRLIVNGMPLHPCLVVGNFQLDDRMIIGESPMLLLGCRRNVVARFISGVEIHGLCLVVLQLGILFHKLTFLKVAVLHSAYFRHYFTRHLLIGSHSELALGEIIRLLSYRGVSQIGRVVKGESNVSSQFHPHFLFVIVVGHDVLVPIKVVGHRIIILRCHETISRVVRTRIVKVGFIGKVRLQVSERELQLCLV